MALTEADKDWIKLLARDVAFKVNKEVLISHIASCPHGQRMIVGKWLIVGVFVGCAVASGLGAGGVLALARLLAGI